MAKTKYEVMVDVISIAADIETWPRIEEIIKELKQSDGESWACGQVLENCLLEIKKRSAVTL